MPQLRREIKVFIVQHLAMFLKPQEVAGLVKEHFGISVDRQRVFAYYPDQGKISKDLEKEFFDTRKKFLENIQDIPIANQAYRLQELQNSFDRQRNSGRPNEMLLMDILEQAAKEVGQMFTNQRRLAGPNGEPLQMNNVVMAQIVFAQLNEKGMAADDAIKFVTDRYRVSQTDLLTDAGS